MPRGKKAAPTGDGMNSQAAPERLLNFVERYERLDADKQAIAEDQKELISELKGVGFDSKVFRKVIALRKRKPDEVAEEEAVLELYLAALGMTFSPEAFGDYSGGGDDDAESMV